MENLNKQEKSLCNFTDLQIYSIISILKLISKYGCLRLNELSVIFLGNTVQTKSYLSICTKLNFVKRESYKKFSVFTVTPKGVAFFKLVTGKNLILQEKPGYLDHYLLIVDYLLSRELSDYLLYGKKSECYADLHILKYKSLDCFKSIKKVPDGIHLYLKNNQKVFDWIEIERTKKNQTNMTQFVSFLESTFKRLVQNQYSAEYNNNSYKLNKIIVLCSKKIGGPEAYKSRLINAIKNYSINSIKNTGNCPFAEYKDGVNGFISIITKFNKIEFYELSEDYTNSEISFVCADLEKRDKGEYPDSPFWQDYPLFRSNIWSDNSMDENRELLINLLSK